MQYLREQAKGTIKEYVTEHLPEQYQVCLSALETILKHAFEILETTDDNREKLQAMELFKDTHLAKLELLSNAKTIDSALNYIRSCILMVLYIRSCNCIHIICLESFLRLEIISGIPGVINIDTFNSSLQGRQCASTRIDKEAILRSRSFK